MRHKAFLLVALAALGLVACKHNPGIIKYPNPLTDLKNAPSDSAKQDRQAAAQTHAQLAAAYMRQGRLKDAQAALKKAIGFDDQYAPAHTMLAILNWRINRLQDADKEFRAAIALDPSNGDTNNNYGRFICQQGRTQDAMPYFTRALADPFYRTPAVANANAGACLLRGGDPARARPYLEKALQLNANYPTALLAMARLDYQRGDAFAARGYLQRFDAADQATADSLLLGYQIATRLGDKESATRYSRRLFDKFPNSAQAQSLNGPRQ